MRKMKALLLLSLLVGCALCDEKCKDIHTNSPIMRLKIYLFCNYESSDPPSNKDGDGVALRFGMIPRMAEFDETTDSLEIHALTYVSWIDERLSWDPTSFGNITSVNVESWRLWGPDFTVHSRGGGEVNRHTSTPCHLSHVNGTVVCLPMLSYTTRCNTDFKLWPHDRQNCTLVLGTWAYTGNEIGFKDFVIPPVHMDEFVNNGEWRTIVSRATYEERQAHYFQNVTTPVIAIDFILDRVHSRIRAIYTTPGIILMLMTLTTLWLDPGSTERLSVACLNPLLHLICIQNLHWALPHNGDTVPYILLFYINSFVLAILALLLTFVVRAIRGTRRTPPKWISGPVARALRSKIGQILLLCVLDPRASAGVENGADDAGDLVDATDRKEPATWTYLTLIIGWIAYISFFLTYIVMYACLMPSASMKPPLNAYRPEY